MHLHVSTLRSLFAIYFHVSFISLTQIFILKVHHFIYSLVPGVDCSILFPLYIFISSSTASASPKNFSYHRIIPSDSHIWNTMTLRINFFEHILYRPILYCVTLDFNSYREFKLPEVESCGSMFFQTRTRCFVSQYLIPSMCIIKSGYIVLALY